MVKKTKGGYAVYSHRKGHKKLSRTYRTLSEAAKRLQQIQYFKHAGK